MQTETLKFTISIDATAALEAFRQLGEAFWRLSEVIEAAHLVSDVTTSERIEEN